MAALPHLVVRGPLVLVAVGLALSCTSTPSATPAAAAVEDTDEADPQDGATREPQDVTATDTAPCHTLGCACIQASDCKSGLCKATAGGLTVCVNCVPSNGSVETCDGLDNDCDGVTDEATCPSDGPCRVGVCKDKKCATQNVSDILCSDGNPCTQGDLCADGVCKGGATECDDTNVCTTDSCDPAVGCVFLPADGTCTDDNACSLDDLCVQGVCKGSIKDCNDKNPCTDDACSYTSGACLATPNTATCDDGNPCTWQDSCAAGKCKPGQPVCPP